LAGKILKKMLAFFYIAQFIGLLIVFNVQMPVNMETILVAFKDTVELNALPKEEIKKNISGPAKEMLNSGGIMAFVALPAIAIVVLLFFLCNYISKKSPKLQILVKKVEKIVFFGAIIKIL
jgi:hypothetical protein